MVKSPKHVMTQKRVYRNSRQQYQKHKRESNTQKTSNCRKMTPAETFNKAWDGNNSKRILIAYLTFCMLPTSATEEYRDTMKFDTYFSRKECSLQNRMELQCLNQLANDAEKCDLAGWARWLHTQKWPHSIAISIIIAQETLSAHCGRREFYLVSSGWNFSLNKLRRCEQ